MNLPKLKSGKKEPKQYISENPLEALMGVGGDVVKSIKQDVGHDLVYDAWDQFLGRGNSHNSGGEMLAGQEIDLEGLKEKAKEITEDARDYVREVVHAGEKRVGQDSREVEVKIQEILIEIKQLANSSSELKEKVEIVALEQMTEAPGKYQLNFVEMILEWLRDARMNVEDSLAWFHALRSKKAARQYGVLAKKKGTSFTLSNERVVSTQTG